MRRMETLPAWVPCVGAPMGRPTAGVWTGRLHHPDLCGGQRPGGGWGGWTRLAWVWHPRVSGGHFLGPSVSFSPATAWWWWTARGGGRRGLSPQLPVLHYDP